MAIKKIQGNLTLIGIVWTNFIWHALPAKIHLLQIYIGYIQIHVLNFKYLYSNLQIYILNLENISSKL